MGPAAIVALLLAQSAADPITIAANHLRERNFDAAIRALSQAATQQPRSALVHLLLGQAYLGKGSAELVAQAKAEFQEAQNLDPTQTLPSFYIAKIDLDLGRITQAERELRRALERKPREHYLLALLGEVHRQKGDAQRAIQLTSEAIASGPDALPVHYYRALAYWDLRDETRALSDLDRLLNTPFVTVDALVLAGTIHLQKNRPNEAEFHLRKAIGLDAARAEPHLRLAQVLRKQRRFQLALQELARVEAAPQLSSPYFQKLLADAACEQGLIRVDQGDKAAARVWFQRALEIDPSHEAAAAALKP